MVSDPALWTSDELVQLSDSELLDVIERDLRSSPEQGASRADLIDHVLAHQAASSQRGIVYTAPAFGEGWLLFERDTELRVREALDRIEAVTTWGEVRDLMAHGDLAGALLMGCLPEEPMISWMSDALEATGAAVLSSGLSDEDARQSLFLIPPQTPVALPNMLDDGGGFVFANPMDPRAMGVPEIVVRRYCIEQRDYEEFALVLPEEHAMAAQTTLDALGWQLLESPGGRLPLE